MMLKWPDQANGGDDGSCGLRTTVEAVDEGTEGREDGADDVDPRNGEPRVLLGHCDDESNKKQVEGGDHGMRSKLRQVLDLTKRRYFLPPTAVQEDFNFQSLESAGLEYATDGIKYIYIEAFTCSY
jgi:hypothetical protein